MSDLVNGFHHVGLITSSMDATIGALERLGFDFTPVSMPRIVLRDGGPPEELGVGNRTAVFAHTYLEVLAVTDPDRWAQISPQQRGPYDIDGPLQRYEGLHVLHFDSDDLEAVRQRLVDHGVACGQIRPFQRQVDTADGHQIMRARALAFPGATHPEALIQIAQHLTPELVLQPRYQSHPNGAEDVVSVTVCAADPEAVGRTYSRMTGRPAAPTVDGVVEVSLGRGRVRIAAPEMITRLFPGVDVPAAPSLVEVTVAVQDVDTTRAVLRDHDVPARRSSDSLRVDPSHASGAVVTFVPLSPARRRA